MASRVLAYLLPQVILRRRGRLLAAVLLALCAAPAAANAQATTTICHATGDPAAPYQQIDVPQDETVDHLQHGEDIVPAPPEGCPAQVVPDEPDEEPAYPLPTPTATPPDRIPPQERPQRPGRRPRERAQPAPQSQAEPSINSGGLTATASVDEGEDLPLTGAEVPAVALMGLSFLLVGAGLRLRLRA